MKSYKKYLSFLAVIIVINLVLNPLPISNAYTNDENAQELGKEIKSLEKIIKKLKERLYFLEPERPTDIIEPKLYNMKLPSKIYPIKEVIESSNEISFETIIDKPNYIRPIYEKHWHSTTGRWSYIPNRIRTAQHRLFTEYDIGLSNWYDFEHDIGFEIPMIQDKKALDIYIVTFQTEITKVYTKGNQIVVVGYPKRNGVQVSTITTKDLKPANKKEFLLIQLVTPDGYEIDYTLISYVEPDYWTKIKEKRNVN